MNSFRQLITKSSCGSHFTTNTAMDSREWLTTPDKDTLVNQVFTISNITGRISDFLSTADCWACQQVFPAWVSTAVFLDEDSSPETVTRQLSKCAWEAHISLVSPGGPTTWTGGGALKMLQSCLRALGPSDRQMFSLTRLDLSKQSINIVEYLGLLSAETLTPELKHLTVTIHGNGQDEDLFEWKPHLSLRPWNWFYCIPH